MRGVDARIGLTDQTGSAPYPSCGEERENFSFFLNNVHKMERAGGGKGVGGLWVGEFPSKNACSYEENSQSVVGDIASCAS